MRAPTTTVFLAVILAFFSFYGAIDVRSGAQSTSMTSTSTTPGLQVPSGHEDLTIDGTLLSQAPFSFISSTFGDVNSWTVDMGPGNEDNETLITFSHRFSSPACMCK
ncbi:hypothetical protein FGLOB1_10138 [Fusarium globosum]|uniref:Uncharacterized protein n=1 Tax=Fusarium globosum TaxID=78864 RepID=A0A8H5XWJ7_9HYPO|nr:hypothetical protein FGLOB1_10138 [Fusarium globosum]